jgi:hypothetical protein
MKKEKVDEKFQKVKKIVIDMIEKTNNIEEFKRIIYSLGVTTLLSEAFLLKIDKKKK